MVSERGGDEGVKHVDNMIKVLGDRESSRCKGPEMEAFGCVEAEQQG